MARAARSRYHGHPMRHQREDMNLATPQGFRDVLADEAVAREAITRSVADLLAGHGYA